MSSLFVCNSTGCVRPLSHAHRRAEMYNIEINFSFQLSLHTHTKGVTSFCHWEKMACFPLTSLHILLPGDRGVNISYYGDCTSPSKLLTFLAVYGRLECVCHVCAQNAQGRTVFHPQCCAIWASKVLLSHPLQYSSCYRTCKIKGLQWKKMQWMKLPITWHWGTKSSITT